MKTLIKKIKNTRGESLTESLAAILIFTMSSIILLSMIATAAKINYEAKQSTEKMDSELYYAEAQDSDEVGVVVSDAAIEVSIKDDPDSDSVPVIVYSGGEGKLYSFEWRKEE